VIGTTVGAALAAASARLAEAGVEAPQREARLLLGHATGLGPTVLIGWPERVVEADTVHRFEALVGRRLAREPVARILGRREFWSLDFTVTADTLDPRPDTETLVEAVLSHLPDRHAAWRVADLGTGTGCILLALLSELPEACGVGIDRSLGAANVARANAIALGLGRRAGFAVGDWTKALAGRFDIVVSNPPYIATAELARLSPEVVLYDPSAALDGGADGLDAYRLLAPECARLLGDGGLAAFETGAGQARAVAALCQAAGLSPLEIRVDLANIERVVLARSLAPIK
jgi:release factor glutamine methyltransferase